MVPSLITEDQNRILTSWTSEKEVRSALFMMHPEKAPDPDGMTALFFQKSWSIIKTILLIWLMSFSGHDLWMKE